MEKVHYEQNLKKKNAQYEEPTLGFKINKFLNKIRGIPVEMDLTPYTDLLDQIKSIDFSHFSDSELQHISAGLREKVRSGVPLDELLVEAFALVREVSSRQIGLKPFDVQIIAGIVMHNGKIAELPTGEGKTLAAVFPVYLNALTGKGVHVLTFNDYLARRDAEWMGPIYKFLGLEVGCNQEGMSISDKQAAYRKDITYTTAKEAGFDYLRDHLCYKMKNLIHLPFHFALVDEADSILIDEARVPLVIAGQKDKSETRYCHLADITRKLTPETHFHTDNEKRNIYLTDSGLEYIEKTLGYSNLHSAQNIQLLTAINCALHAEVLLERDKDYILRNGKIEIVDEFTGRVVDKRHWPDGLQAAVEAKENIQFKSEGTILGSITLQHYFRLYSRLCGMTATARSGTAEFNEFYKLGIVIIPPHRPRMSARVFCRLSVCDGSC